MNEDAQGSRSLPLGQLVGDRGALEVDSGPELLECGAVRCARSTLPLRWGERGLIGRNLMRQACSCS